jgi:hypothetical protein
MCIVRLIILFEYLPDRVFLPEDDPGADFAWALQDICHQTMLSMGKK